MLAALAGTVAATVTVPGLEAVGDAVDATPLQLLSWFRQSEPENAEPAKEAQELNWCVQAAEAAEGRSTKTSSRTMKEPMLPWTPGGAPPRERKKTKKETTSTKTVVVEAVVASAVVVAWVVVARVAWVVAARVVGAVVKFATLATEVTEVFVVVVELASVMTQEVAAPPPLS